MTLSKEDPSWLIRQLKRICGTPVKHKPIFIGGRRDHINNPAGYPSPTIAFDGFNKFIGRCVGQGLNKKDYENSKELLTALEPFLDKLNNLTKGH